MESNETNTNTETNTETSETNGFTNTGEGTAGSSNDGSSESTETNVGEGEDNDQIVAETDEGKRIVAAFEKRIAKLVAQRNSAESFLEAVKSDPNVRREFLESLKDEAGEASATSSEAVQEPDELDNFVAAIPNEHRPHYQTMFGALGARFEKVLEAREKAFYEKAIKPIMSWIGSEKLERFSQTNKDFAKYRKEAERLISEGRVHSLEDAYKILSYEDKIKGASNKGAKDEQSRRESVTRQNFSQRNSGGTSNTSSKVNTLRDSIRKAVVETGYGQ